MRSIPAEAAEQYLATGTGLIIQQSQGDSHGENLAISLRFDKNLGGLKPKVVSVAYVIVGH